MDKSPASVIREEIRGIAAYHVPDSTGMVKLDAMENPYGLPSDLTQADLESSSSWIGITVEGGLRGKPPSTVIPIQLLELSRSACARPCRSPTPWRSCLATALMN